MLRPGDVLALIGELGAGKTTLVRALALGLGIDSAAISSPTFVLMNVYRREVGPAVLHLDAYRIRGAEDLEATGWQELSPDAVTIIEWADRVEDALPAERLNIRLRHAPGDSRVAIIEVPDSWSTRAGVARLTGRTDATCPVTGRRVPADSPTWPFVDERARLVDLGRWFDGRYAIGRSIEPQDSPDT